MELERDTKQKGKAYKDPNKEKSSFFNLFKLRTSQSSNSADVKLWSKLESHNSTPRSGAASIIVDNILYLVGGVGDTGTFSQDLLRYNLDTQKWLEPIVFAPDAFPGRCLHSLVYYCGKLYMFGGKANGYRNDIHEFNLETKQWTKLTVTGKTPSPRYGHTAAIFGKSMYIFGGYDNMSMCCNDMYEYFFDTNMWNKVEIKNNIIPPSRFSHSVSVSDSGFSMYIFGGQGDGKNPYNDLYEFRFTSKTWLHLETKGKIPSRWGHISFVYGPTLYIFGGQNKSSMFEDTWTIQTLGSDLTWTQISATKGDIPSGRVYHTCNTTQQGVLICGGRNDQGTFKDLYQHIFLFSYWDLLPEEIMNEIFGYLDHVTLSRVLLVSKRWKEIASANNLWKVHAHSLFGKTLETQTNYRKFIMDNTSTDLNPTTPILWRNPSVWGTKKDTYSFAKIYPKDYHHHIQSLKTIWVEKKSEYSNCIPYSYY